MFQSFLKEGGGREGVSVDVLCEIFKVIFKTEFGRTGVESKVEESRQP